MIKVSVHQENINVINMYDPSKRASKYMKEDLSG